MVYTWTGSKADEHGSSKARQHVAGLAAACHSGLGSVKKGMIKTLPDVINGTLPSEQRSLAGSHDADEPKQTSS